MNKKPGFAIPAAVVIGSAIWKAIHTNNVNIRHPYHQSHQEFLMLWWAVNIVTVTVLFTALAWDLYIIFGLKLPLSDGKSASYQSFKYISRNPVAGVCVGLYSALVIVYAWPLVAAFWFTIVGHVTFVMREVT